MVITQISAKLYILGGNMLKTPEYFVWVKLFLRVLSPIPTSPYRAFIEVNLYGNEQRRSKGSTVLHCDTIYPFHLKIGSISMY